MSGVDFDLHHDNFAAAESLLDGRQVDVLLADLGVSTDQLLDEERGLSFTHPEAPLDMRLDPTLHLTAADLLRRWPEKRIADTIYQLGDERFSRRIARRIVEAAPGGGIKTVGQLANLVRRCVPRSGKGRAGSTRRRGRSWPCGWPTNGELDAITKLLDAIRDYSNPAAGRRSSRSTAGKTGWSKNAFREQASLGLVDDVTKKPLVPSEDEVASGPRSRSAKLRVVRFAVGR